MKKIHLKIFSLPLALFISALGTLSSCIDDVDDVNLPKVDPKLVIQSFISPGDSIVVSVMASRPINYNVPVTGGWDFNTFDIVSDATVIIRNNQTNTDAVINFDQQAGKYKIGQDVFPILSGVEYTLTVSAPRFKSVTANTKVPDYLPNISPIEFDTLTNYEYGDQTIVVSGRISDIPNQENYYSVMMYQLTTYNWDGYIETYLDFESQDIVSDLGKDGDEIGFKIEYWNYATENRKVYFFIHTTDEHYYRFYNSLRKVEDFESNPFAESSILYSNVEGGLGVFGSFLPVVSIIIQ